MMLVMMMMTMMMMIIIIIIMELLQHYHGRNFRGAGGRSDQCSVKALVK